MGAKRVIAGAASVLGVGCALLVASRSGATKAEAVSAHTQAQAQAQAAPRTVRADGVVVARPGTRATLSSQTESRVARVLVSRGEHVKRGQILVEFEANEQTAALREAWARANEARTMTRARVDEQRRTKTLVASGSVATRELDDASHALRTARAHAAAEGATTQRVAAALAKSRIIAPLDGTIIARNVEPGETVTPSAPLLEIADMTQLRIEAEVDEYNLGQVALGAAARVTTEGFPGRTWDGALEEASDVVTPRRLNPEDPARPRDVGVLHVWITLPSEHPLKLGQRVEVGLSPPTRGEASAQQPARATKSVLLAGSAGTRVAPAVAQSLDSRGCIPLGRRGEA